MATEYWGSVDGSGRAVVPAPPGVSVQRTEVRRRGAHRSAVQRRTWPFPGSRPAPRDTRVAGDGAGSYRPDGAREPADPYVSAYPQPVEAYTSGYPQSADPYPSAYPEPAYPEPVDAYSNPYVQPVDAYASTYPQPVDPHASAYPQPVD